MRYVLIILFLLSTSGNLLSDVCSKIAKNPSLFIDKYSNKDGYSKFDIDNDGNLNNVNCEWAGTADIGMCYYLSEDNQKINFGGDDDNGRLWGNIYFINFNNKSYILNSKNKKEPLFLSLSNSKVCKFKTNTIEKLIPESTFEYSKDICNAIENNDLTKISYIDFLKKPNNMIKASFQINTESFENTPQWNFPKKIAKFDYNNDGTNNNILEISYRSSAKRGCTYNYFDELDENYESKQSEILSKTRDLMNCGGEYNAFLKYNNLIYFKHREKNYDTSRNTYKVYLFKNNNIQTVCDYKQELVVEVKK